MKYSKDEVIEYTREEDVKFIRLSYAGRTAARVSIRHRV